MVQTRDSTLSTDELRIRKANTDFIWQEWAEPHAERKRRILKEHTKEVNALMGVEPMTKYIASAVVILQMVIAFTIGRYYCIGWPSYIIFAFIIGGTANHNIFLAIHEITHNLAFRKPIHNDIFAMFVNIPICFPYAMVFKVYHAEHHRYQGWDGVDTDIPSSVETILFRSTIGKFIFACFQIVFYALRPCIVRKIKISFPQVMNWVVFIAVWYGLYMIFGWDRTSAAWGYTLLSTFLAGCLHPLSGHFISEHYIFDPEAVQETYSYYGPLNILGWNVGLHNEHHDFPNIPWSRLGKLTAVAPEYYDHLLITQSWPGTILQFIMDYRVTTYSRVKREREAWKRSKLIPTTTQLSPLCDPVYKDKYQ
eukprot:Tbor_TRINITY_DN4719_c0_g2::TRINITY_DN4719_c0_g2_i1::g.16917::m.16917/K04712/DEGS; sphingolipid 4-desaturase/C4-monooxygenase